MIAGLAQGTWHSVMYCSRSVLCSLYYSITYLWSKSGKAVSDSQSVKEKHIISTRLCFE